MNTKKIQHSQEALALYLDLLAQADQFCGNGATLIQLSFPHDQEHATALHNEFLEEFIPFRNYLLSNAVSAFREQHPEMADETIEQFSAILERGMDKGQFTEDIAEQLQRMNQEENQQPDNDI